MKINKKVLIPVFATAMGLSVIGGISGAVAWYQYNSKVSASFIGASVADTGVLQIGWEEVDDNDTPEDTSDDTTEIVWGRDFNKLGKAAHLVPVTFGELGTNGVLGSTAYAYPEAGAGEGYDNYAENYANYIGDDADEFPHWVEASESDYAQFKLYFKAYQANAETAAGFDQVVRNVFLSDYIFSTDSGKKADEALRVHIQIGDEGRLLSLNEHKHSDTESENTELALFGGLDLDKNGHNDQYHATAWNDQLKIYGTEDDDDDDQTAEVAIHAENEEIVYGEKDKYQETEAIADLKVSRDANGQMPQDDTDANFAKKLFATEEDEAVEVTVTIWLEGWELIDGAETAIWNPNLTAGCDVQVGLQFDTGIFRGADLNQD